MPTAFSATTLPTVATLATTSEFGSAEERRDAVSFPTPMLQQWDPSGHDVPRRVEVLVHEYPLWISDFGGEAGPSRAAEECPALVFDFDDPEAESTRNPAGHDRWIGEVTTRLGELAALAPDWDGHGGRSPDLIFISQAIAFLVAVMRSGTPSPSIVPTSDGGLQLEWHRSGLDVEILFSPEEDPTLYIHERATGSEYEVPSVGGFIEFDLGMRLAD